jgi:hypothetical protein
VQPLLVRGAAAPATGPSVRGVRGRRPMAHAASRQTTSGSGAGPLLAVASPGDDARPVTVAGGRPRGTALPPGRCSVGSRFSARKMAHRVRAPVTSPPRAGSHRGASCTRNEPHLRSRHVGPAVAPGGADHGVELEVNGRRTVRHAPTPAMGIRPPLDSLMEPGFGPQGEPVPLGFLLQPVGQHRVRLPASHEPPSATLFTCVPSLSSTGGGRPPGPPSSSACTCAQRMRRRRARTSKSSPSRSTSAKERP